MPDVKGILSGNVQEESNQNIMRNVTMKVSSLIPGSGSYIRNMKVRYNGQIVNQIPAGGAFDIICDFSAENSAGGIIQAWSACVTVIDTEGGEVRNYKIENSAFSLPGHIADSNVAINSRGGNIMPNHDINLRFMLWGNDSLLGGGATPPAQNLW